MKTSELDVAYIVRDGDDNEELRYSLRSLSNLDFSGNIHIYGYKPDWVKGVRDTRTDQRRYGLVNSLNNIITACNDPALSDPFILMHDDFFIVEPVKEITPKHRGTYEDMLAGGVKTYYERRMERTYRYLRARGYSTYCYEMHMPFIIHKQQFLEVSELTDFMRMNKMSVYGNYHGIGGDKTQDVKVKSSNEIPAGAYISTHDKTFATIEAGKYVRSLFPRKGKNEK